PVPTRPVARGAAKLHQPLHVGPTTTVSLAPRGVQPGQPFLAVGQRRWRDYGVFQGTGAQDAPVLAVAELGMQPAGLRAGITDAGPAADQRLVADVDDGVAADRCRCIRREERVAVGAKRVNSSA